MTKKQNRVMAVLLTMVMLCSLWGSGIPAQAKVGEPGDHIKSAKIEIEPASEYNTWWVKYLIEPAEYVEVVPTDIVVILDYSARRIEPLPQRERHRIFHPHCGQGHGKRPWRG